jgi:3-deoxy-D-manno-octulosonic-acid transferase
MTRMGGTETRPDRGEGPLVWFHAGARPPDRAILDLAGRLQRLETPVSSLITISPATPIDAADVPVVELAADRVGRVREFLDLWRPDAGVWTTCELRPGLIGEAEARGIPLSMIDAGGLRPDLTGWRWRLRNVRGLLAAFDPIFAGDQATAEDLRRIGADPARVTVTGRLEEAAPPPPADDEDLAEFAARVASRPVWLAARIMPDEETAAVIEAHRRGLQRAHRLLLILVPDDPADAPDLAARLRDDGWNVTLRSEGGAPATDCQIYLVDTADEPGLWYRLAPICFLGRSLAPGGGISPAAAAALGSAILHGPNVRDHAPAYARLTAANASRRVATAEELAGALEDSVSPDVAAAMAQAAWDVASCGAEVTDRVVTMLTETLEARGVL